jgi:hypothetical protein
LAPSTNFRSHEVGRVDAGEVVDQRVPEVVFSFVAAAALASRPSWVRLIAALTSSR